MDKYSTAYPIIRFHPTPPFFFHLQAAEPPYNNDNNYLSGSMGDRLLTSYTQTLRAAARAP